MVEVWGSGRPLREFLYVDDLADALVFLEPVGVVVGEVGVGEEVEDLQPFDPTRFVQALFER